MLTYGRRSHGCTSSRLRRRHPILRWTISFPARRDHFMTLRRVYMSSWRIGCCSRSRATHNARSHLALSRFSSGRPAPAPRCKCISLHLAAPCTEVQADFPASAPPVRVVCIEFWHLRCGSHACSGLFRCSLHARPPETDQRHRERAVLEKGQSCRGQGDLSLLQVARVSCPKG